jgi:hypothetical protein
MDFELLRDKNFWPVVVDKEFNVGYIPIPKVANTSILNAMLEWKGEGVLDSRVAMIKKDSNLGVPLDSPSRVHFYQRQLFDLTFSKTKDCSSYFIFSCVRHPVKRFISFYRDKILRWDPNIESKLHSHGFYQGMSVDKCIESLLKCVPSELEQHLRPMVCFLFNEGKLLPDFVFKLESMNNGWEFISELVNKKVPLVSENSSDQQGVAPVVLSDHQIELIKKYYEVDMKVFGYE